jgi:hypothetical protein
MNLNSYISADTGLGGILVFPLLTLSASSYPKWLRRLQLQLPNGNIMPPLQSQPTQATQLSQPGEDNLRATGHGITG